MTFDYKKEFQEFYFPPNTPEFKNIPTMNYVAVRGEGNPNEEDGAYSRAVAVLYAISYTIKMSYKGTHDIKGFSQYVVPPLEGLCVQMMHVGEYDRESETVKKMDDFIHECGYENDFTDVRLHHEIYLSDPRKTAKEKCKTVIRHPIKRT